MFVSVQLLEDTPTILSPRKLCEENGHTYECKERVTNLYPGRSIEAHLTSSAEDPAESTKFLTSDEQETTLASRDRGIDCRSCQNGYRISRKNWWNQDQHLLEVSKDPICEICKRTKVTRAACRQNSQSHMLRATKFGDIIPADHKHEVLNEEKRIA